MAEPDPAKARNSIKELRESGPLDETHLGGLLAAPAHESSIFDDDPTNVGS